jgi:hypothetical protein
MIDLNLYTLTFCRLAIGFVFAWSFLAKVRDIRAFEQAIRGFDLIPSSFARIAALLLLAAEASAAILLFAGGSVLLPGFSLAILLLATFSAAIILSLVRNNRASCNCFGYSDKPLSRYELTRNIGLLLVSAAGLVLLLVRPEAGYEAMSAAELGFLAAAAAAFSMLWISLRHIMALFVDTS